MLFFSIKNDRIVVFSRYGSWPLDVTKTMSEDVRTFPTIGDFILRTSLFRQFLSAPSPLPQPLLLPPGHRGGPGAKKRSEKHTCYFCCYFSARDPLLCLGNRGVDVTIYWPVRLSSSSTTQGGVWYSNNWNSALEVLACTYNCDFINDTSNRPQTEST